MGPLHDHRREARAAAANAAIHRVSAAPAKSGAPADVAGTDGLRACARGDWCEARTVTIDGDGERHVQPMLGYQAFCPADELLIESNLRRLPYLYRVLWGEIGNPVRRAQAIRVPFGPSIPIRLDVEAMMRCYDEVLVSWEERVRAAVPGLDELDTNDSRCRRGYIAIDQAADVLVKNLAVLLALPPEMMTRTRRDILENDEHMGGAQAGLEILTLEYLGRATLGITDAKPEQIVGVPCPECKKLALRRSELWEKSDMQLGAACMACGTRMTVGDYGRWLRDQAAAARAAYQRPTLSNTSPIRA